MSLRARIAFFPLILASAVCFAQTAQPAAGEITTKESPVTFRTKVNLVSIPVVARDSQGHAIGNLGREDFQLYDNGKLQTISRFSVEKFDAPAEGSASPVPAPRGAETPPPSKAVPALPDRFVAYVFDDLNTRFNDLAQARDAAYRHMMTSLRPADRAAVYTTSGEGGIDFTADREKLRSALLAIRTHFSLVQSADCPPLTAYQANGIANGDVMALGAAMADLNRCAQQPFPPDDAEWRVRNAARVMLSLLDRNIDLFLNSLEGIVRKLSIMAGQRTLVLVSSGFLMTADRRQEESAVLERAIRANVVINSVDARALYALAPGLDASAHTIDSAVDSLPMPGAPQNGGTSGSGGSSLVIKAQEARDEALANRDVMAEVAANTGGRFFEGSNDLQGGFERVASAPEFIYVLGFAPQELKLDGKYHNLRVSLHSVKGVTLEARRGYFAPRYTDDPGERSKEEIEEAFFARSETRDIPVTMQTQFFKTSDYEATLTVSAKIDVRQLPFRKEADRNRDDLTVVAGLFDSDGNYVAGTQKVVEMRLRDETLQGRVASGITIRNTFSVAPGAYFVRLVIRDAEGQSMSAHGEMTEIR